MPSNCEVDIGLGALLISGLIAMALWGVACVQVYTYFIGSSSDRLLLKAMIASLCVLTTFDSALVCHFLYYYLIMQFGNPLAMLSPFWSNAVHNAIRPVIGFILRTMFTHRVYILSDKSIRLTVWITVLSFTGFVAAVFVTITGFGPFTSYQQAVEYLDLAAVTLANLSITVSLCYLLHRSRTGFRRTNSVIRVLMMYTVNTGGIVTLGSSLSLVEAVTNFRGPSDILGSFAIILNGMYLNSYLASLNAREGIRNQFQTSGPVSVQSQFLSPMNFAPNSESTSLPRP
ncbi:hypothetical protein BDN72DRAFT_303413 [Pluteus cervinus]|uniref:Uncharacterized protein n=1 Tax=Pluteus cervinus TaxID=181527 RepID=A0ACD3B3S9_9AGAR|nr:hypothetical protein BDN72DRAFT_303413 [Pluteus cervinus]